MFGDINTRLDARLQEEMHIIGPHIYGKGISALIGTPTEPPQPHPNRECLLDLANQHALVVASTFKTPNKTHRITYREIGTKKGDPFDENKYTQLDHVISKRNWLPAVQSVRSYPHQHWTTNHFMRLTVLSVRLGAKQQLFPTSGKLSYGFIPTCHRGTASRGVRKV